MSIKTTDRIQALLGVLVIVLWLGGVYAIIHFVVKYW
jgi:hypothetical protein